MQNNSKNIESEIITMTLMKLIGTTNNAMRMYEGKFCTVTQNKTTKQLCIAIINTATTITTSPCIEKTELGNLIVGRTENSSYFFEKIAEI